MYPIIILSITGLITLFLGFLKNKQLLMPATLVFIAIAFISNFCDWNKPGLYFNEMLSSNNISILFTGIILISAFCIVGMSRGFQNDHYGHGAEYYAIMQFSLVGAIMMTNYQNIIMLFLGVEIMSVSLYILTGSDKHNLRGNEAALKYFLMGAFATGIMLFGMAMLYGAIGSFDIGDASAMIAQFPESSRPIYLGIGLTFLLIGMLFKVSAAPFHFWTPDVYEGAPTIFTAFMATVVKTAGFAAIYRILSVSFIGLYDNWRIMLIGITILSLLVGNISAVYQQNFKRMLAFSSISHAGFMLLAILGMSSSSEMSIIFYSFAYSLATISAFGVLMIVSEQALKNGRPNEDIEVFNGLSKQNSFLAVILTIAMLSMAGIPLTAGFWAKFFVFTNAVGRNYAWVLIIAVLMSAVGLYYYFRPILAIYAKKNTGKTMISIPLLYKIILIFTTICTILLGLFPNLLRGLL